MEHVNFPSNTTTTTWRTAHGDLTDQEWALISDLLPVYTGNGAIGRPLKHDRRAVVDAIL
jgi:transposase